MIQSWRSRTPAMRLRAASRSASVELSLLVHATSLRMIERCADVISHTALVTALNRSVAASVRNTRSKPNTGEVSSNGVSGS